jgi:replicative DNA helicase
LEPDQWTLLRTAANRRAQSPIWIIGHSQTEFAKVGSARPRMTMTDAFRAMELICSGKITGIKQKPRLVVLDYLQRIRPDSRDGGTRREQQMEAVNKAKDMSVTFGCPVMLGVQAGRQVMERDNKLPTIDDAQETSNVEQSADKFLSVWYPIKTEKAGSFMDGVPVTPNLLVIGLLKQKNGPAPLTYKCFVDPEKIIVGSLKKKTDENQKQS